MFDWSIPIKVHQSFQNNRMGFIFCQIRQSQSKLFEKVFEAGIQDQPALLNKTLTKFLIENFDRVNGPMVKSHGQRVKWIR